MNTKEQFFKEQYISLLEQLSDNEVGLWGVLSPQGMIEHMSDCMGAAYGRIKLPLSIPEEFVEKSRAFALSDKPFKENTKNALMSETPAPLRTKSMTEAIAELEQEIKAFFAFYDSHPGHKELNAFFGELNYEEQLHLLHKHAWHHLKQFNLD
ncbi:MAG: DinB family protein [Bacteroidota bacterium]